MSEYPSTQIYPPPLPDVTRRRRILSYLLHFILFLATFVTTTLAGVQWLNRNSFDLSNFTLGLPYSIALLAILSAHEFGHYFAARYHGVNSTLPYFIPIPPYIINPFGTMGAVIRIRSSWQTKRSLFDIGIAGPLAGFVVTMAILLYGFLTLPGREYLYSIHPEYRVLAQIPTAGLTFGDSLLFGALSKLFALRQFVPPMNEVYHYPYLCAGWFGLFVTALNLLPVGQLDGGHIMYALVGGRRQSAIARAFFGALIMIGLLSLVPIFGLKLYIGTSGWLLWAAILFFIIKLDHPPIPDDVPLTPNRIMLGWVTFVIFLLTFPPIPFIER